jgi:hypothetical protein
MAWEWLGEAKDMIINPRSGVRKGPDDYLDRVEYKRPNEADLYAPNEMYYGGEKMPVGAEADLVEHWGGSRKLAKDLGKIPAALGGVWQEYIGTARKEKSPGGFSLDDLMANWAGLMGFSKEQAERANIFQHTEEGSTGAGQGLWKENLKKLSKLHEGDFPFIKGLIKQGETDKQSGSTFRQGEQRQDNQRAPTRATQTKVDPLRSSRKAAGIAQREAKKEFGAGSKEHLKAIGVTQEAGRKLKGRK